ncbi:MAG: hypothetical protein LQ340_000489 [Diploschistes diacapsis]|nr:MAG: hypothetical protein LQ340_000489 [Diploschistes diacapsis]
MSTVGKSPTGNYGSLPASLPPANLPGDLDLESVATACGEKLGGLTEGDVLASNAIWRDTYAFTGTLRTFYGISSIKKRREKLSLLKSPHSFRLVPGAFQRLEFGNPASHAWIQAQFEFGMVGDVLATGRVLLSIVPDSGGDWKIWVLRTMLEGFRGFPSVNVLRPIEKSSNLTNGHGNANGFNSTEQDGFFDLPGWSLHN